jgi:hypothetical protein
MAPSRTAQVLAFPAPDRFSLKIVRRLVGSSQILCHFVPASNDQLEIVAFEAVCPVVFRARQFALSTTQRSVRLKLLIQPLPIKIGLI